MLQRKRDGTVVVFSGITHEGVKACSHGAAAVPQGFLPQPLPHMLLHRIRLEPIYLWHLAAPLPLPHSMNTHTGSKAFHFFAAAAAGPCERTFTLYLTPNGILFYSTPHTPTPAVSKTEFCFAQNKIPFYPAPLPT